MSSVRRRDLPALAGAAVLILAIAGSAAAATLQFDDLDGNGVADTCQTAVVANPEAAEAAFTAADTDGDGMISVAEAAHSGWTGGTNCNHGGFVSLVAVASAEDCDETGPVEDETLDEAPAGTDVADCGDAEDGEAVDEAAADDVAPPDDAPADCTAVEPPTEPTAATDELTVDAAPNAHGRAVSEVAQSDSVGGKNCNHGGAVSEAAKGDHAAKPDHAAKRADHAAAMAAKRQARALAKAQRTAAHQAS